MTQYHAVMIDECGGEFGVTFDANDRYEAYEYLQEQYPESRCDQLEDPDDTARRQKAIYDRASRMMDDPYYDD